MGTHNGHRERLRARFLSAGPDAFSTHEMLELLLFYAIPRQDTNPVAHALLERFGSLSAVLSAPLEELQSVKGMGPNSALLLKLVPELRRAMEQEDAEPTVQSTGQVGAYLVRQLADVQEEAVFMFCIDGTGRPVRSRRLTEGGSFFDLRDLGHRIVESAVLMGAQYVVLAHCQLDECFPDNADYGLADFALRALKSVDVQLLDYDLVSGGQYISLRDSGFLYGL